MAAVPNDPVSAAPAPSPGADALVADWERWRARRLEALRAPDGPPALAATYWLADSAVVPGVNGIWSENDHGVELLLSAGADVLIGGQHAQGRVVALGPGEVVGRRLVFPSLTVQVTTRQGRRGVRVFDHGRAARLQSLGAYAPDPSFVLEGSYDALPGPSSVSYSYALESSPREVEVPGVVHFSLAGSDYAVTPLLDEGSLLLVFADRTTGTGTRPPSRFLLIEPPGEGLAHPGPVVVDFNRAFLPPCAFSDEFNCPLPPVHHRLGADVTAGETWAWFADAGPPAGPNY
jgi:uncharacterized protein (DUF1684 family)